MRVRAKLTIRNEAMIAARQRLGLSQLALAEKIGQRGVWLIMQLEQFKYPHRYNQTLIFKIACILGIQPEDVMPEELTGHKVNSQIVGFSELNPKQLIEVGQLPVLPKPYPSDQEFTKTQIGQVLKTLPWREQEIIRLRYGLDDGRAYTLAEVGRIYKITKETVRQLEARAIRKLQHPVRMKKLEQTV
tara:strand:- start:427 stop:990 length:564 start_codon:yes stop_codon:yes gene_type:complete